MRLGILVSLIGIAWSAWPTQDADPDFHPTVEYPTYGRFAGSHPRVLVDEGHYNVHTASGRFRPFADVLEIDGFRVLPSEGAISLEILRNAEIYVTANPLGFKGVVQQAANMIGLERILHLNADAFSDREIETLERWVSSGGRALIVSDHAPVGQAAKRLAAAFGVEMTTWWAEDAQAHDPESKNPAALLFSRENGLLGDHEILNGITRVMTFTGQALKPGPGSTPLLILSPTAREYPFRVSREPPGRSAAGLAQAVAVTYGRGRVVIMGEAAALSAQRIEVPGSPPLLMGMNKPGIDNQQFLLNVMHWLMGLH